MKLEEKLTPMQLLCSFISAPVAWTYFIDAIELSLDEDPDIAGGGQMCVRALSRHPAVIQGLALMQGSQFGRTLNEVTEQILKGSR